MLRGMSSIDQERCGEEDRKPGGKTRVIDGKCGITGGGGNRDDTTWENPVRNPKLFWQPQIIGKA